jgi:ABC-2 type transport system permease protein
VEQDRLKVKEAEIESKKNQAIADSLAEQEQSIAGLQGMVRLAAIALPPLPALLLGLIVYVTRSRRENQGANPERMA